MRAKNAKKYCEIGERVPLCSYLIVDKHHKWRRLQDGRMIAMNHASQRSENRSNKMLGGTNGPAPKRPNLQVWTNYGFNGPNCGKKKLLRRLEAENAELREKAVELVLQIQALRDGDQALTA